MDNQTLLIIAGICCACVVVAVIWKYGKELFTIAAVIAILFFAFAAMGAWK